MRKSRPFLYITFADFLARSAYQMGKTPLLPLFAAMLGATDTFLGIIVSVSTLTGMVLKPVVGLLSDRWGRRGWLFAGTAFFTVVPFFYWFVDTPQQLFIIRIIHGMATAIYGPVTVAYVAEKTPQRRAEGLGWFGMARSAGYIVGPAAAGWMLLTMQPAAVFTVIGILSSVVFLPVLALPETAVLPVNSQPPLRQQIRQALLTGSHTPAVWLAGGLESFAYVALYALRTFLPIYALSIGVNVALVGLFFALQEAVNMLVKPWGGRFGDRHGYRWAIALGMLILGATLPLVGAATATWQLLLLALLLGLGQAFIFPATVALVSQQLNGRHLATGMGIVGTLQNAGKVLGPVIGGLLIARFDFAATFLALGGLLIVGAVALLLRHLSHRKPQMLQPSPFD